MQYLKIERKGLIMSVQINKTTFTPEEQLELQKRLGTAKSREEAQAIFDAYKKEVGLVENTTAVNGNAPVQRAKNAEKPVVGTAVERSANNNLHDANIVSQTSSTTVAFTNIMDGLTKAGYKLDEESGKELKAEFEKAGIAVDKEGKINVTSQETGQKLNNIISKYARGKQETQLQFTKETDSEFISTMEQEGSIKKNEDGTYTVLDKAKAEARLNKD